MEAFRRVFKYVWPQWGRLIVIAVTALIVGVLFAFSIATILPLLKVMMAEEGLHGWVNRKICEDRYGLGFFVPDRFELSASEPNKPQAAYYLQVADVEEDGPAYETGLLPNDLVVGAGGSLDGQVPSSTLLRELATAEKNAPVQIRYRRLDDTENLRTMAIRAGGYPFYAAGARWLLRFVPEGQDKDTRRKAVIFIILLMMATTMIRCLARFYQAYTVNKLMNTTLAHLREDAFEHSLRIPSSYFDTEGPSDTVSRLVRDSTVVGSGIKILLGKTLREPLKAICLMAVAFWLEPKLTLIFLCGAPLSLYASGGSARR